MALLIFANDRIKLTCLNTIKPLIHGSTETVEQQTLNRVSSKEGCQVSTCTMLNGKEICFIPFHNIATGSVVDQHC